MKLLQPCSSSSVRLARYAAPVAVVFAALAATACSGGSYGSNKSVAHSYPASSPGVAAADTDSGGYHGGGAAPAARQAPASESISTGAPAAGADYYEPAPEPDDRPGLGTVWGETVNSRVTTRAFARADSRPFATLALHYNDAEGVRAHADYRGAQPTPYRGRTPHGGIEVMITDERGNALPGGEFGGRTMIVGNDGQRYNIVIINHTGGRFEVVASVDGLDVIDGRPADLAKRGYILDPHQTLTIDGFRQSESAVAAFRFGRVKDSYAARTSGDRNVGVIGLGFFAEQGSVWTTDELRRRDTADPFPGDRTYARPPGY